MVRGVSGAKFQSVRSREEAEALLSGKPGVLTSGTYAFTDGNHEGGVVLVHRRPDGSTITKEIATTVVQVLPDFAGELPRLRNVLAELAALLVSLRAIKPEVSFVVVHDYEGVGAWVTGAWRARDPVVSVIVGRCRDLIREKRLKVTFRHQPGHQATANGDEFALYNKRADELATGVVRDSDPVRVKRG